MPQRQAQARIGTKFEHLDVARHDVVWGLKVHVDRGIHRGKDSVVRCRMEADDYHFSQLQFEAYLYLLVPFSIVRLIADSIEDVEFNELLSAVNEKW